MSASHSLFVATGDAVACVTGVPRDPDVTLTLTDSGTQCVAVDPRDRGRVFAGTFDRGVFRTLDAGETWEDVGAGIPHRRVLSVAVSPCHVERGRSVVYAGTEPSGVFRSDDDGRTWEELDALTELPSRDQWSFPPRPWTHHVRWIAPHHHDPELIFVGIELGGIMRTTDGGETFEDRHPQALADSHVLATHPTGAQRVYAVGGDGVASSGDRGATWVRDVEGMDRTYAWGLAVDPADPDLWYVSSAPGPGHAHGDGDAEARLYRGRGSAPFEALPLDGSAGPLRDMPYSLAAPDAGTLVVGTRPGSILWSEDRGEEWRTLDVDLRRVLQLACA